MNIWNRKMFINSTKQINIVSYLGNGNINNQWKLHVSKLICYRTTPRIKIDIVENRFCLKIPVYLNFYFVFPCAFENFKEFFTFNKPTPLLFLKYPLDSLFFQKRYCWRKSKDFIVLKGDDRHKKKKN